MKFNTKKVALWLTVTMLLSFTVAASIGVSPEFIKSGFNISWGDNPHNNEIANGSNTSKSFTTIDQNTTADASGINNLDISLVSEETTVVLSDDNLVKAHLIGTGSSAVKLTLVEEKIGNEIRIYVRRSPEIAFTTDMFHDLRLEISVPKAYSSNIKIKTVSGAFTLPALKAKNISVETVSGEIESSASAENFVLTTVSGEATLRNLVGNLNTNSISGDVHASFATLNNVSIIGEAVSGSMNLDLPTASSINVDFSSVSGDLENSIGTTSSASNKIKFNSVSGNLTIEKLSE